jgi:hypothetical protein
MQPTADMPFDGKRMIFGGFAPLFDSGSQDLGKSLEDA